MLSKCTYLIAVVSYSLTTNAQHIPQPNVQQGSVMQSIYEYLEDKGTDVNPFSGTAALMHRLKDSFAVFTQGSEYLDHVLKMHHKQGAYRSGQGESHQQYERMNMFEEQDRMAQLQEQETNKQIITNQEDVDKLFEIFQKDYMDGKVRARRNDDKDFIYHKSIPKRLNDIESHSMEERRLQAVNTDDRPFQVVKQLDEPYPTSCKNHGQLVDQIQTYYLCQEIESQEEIRVTKDTFSMLVSQYSDKYKCRVTEVSKKVCVCPQGFDDFTCSTQLYRKCFLNITDPPFHEGCSHKADTPYYLHSVPGYDPCFYFNFSKSYEISYMITCRSIDENGMIKMQRENVGYEYRDVVNKPKYNPFKYVTQNPETEFSIIDTDKAVVSFEFHDWKYLSNVRKTQQIIEDPLVLAGLKPATIELDFSKLEESDSTGQSRFVVGGRTYFEANLFGYHTSSFTTKGFFDKEGFVESEQNSQRSKNQLHVHIVEILEKIHFWEYQSQYYMIIGLLVLLYWTCTSAKKHHQKKHKMD